MKSPFETDKAQALRDEARVLQALDLARLGLGMTSPNPPVGAVIYKEDRFLGSGYHHRAGEPHAERMALADALARGHGDDLKGSTLYVTLEPCSSHGKTPPCTQAIIDVGIKRVVYGVVDPDARHRGRANALLEAEGIEVQGGVAEKACRDFLSENRVSLGDCQDGRHSGRQNREVGKPAPNQRKRGTGVCSPSEVAERCHSGGRSDGENR